MNTTLSGSKTKLRRVPPKAADSIRVTEVESNETDLQFEKHDEQRISIWFGIGTLASQPKYRIIFKRDESRMNEDSTVECEFSASIENEIFEMPANAEPSIKSTSRGIMIDLRAESENAFDSIRRTRESFSDEIDESDWHFSKHDKQRISTPRGITIDLRAER
jgi:hypothetical protein